MTPLYNAEFGAWLARHDFADMDKGDRSRLIEVMDNRAAIEGWRATLPLTARLRLNHPSTVLRKWKAVTEVREPKEPKATLRDSVASLDEANASKPPSSWRGSSRTWPPPSRSPRRRPSAERSSRSPKPAPPD